MIASDLGGGIAGDPSRVQVRIVADTALEAAESAATDAIRFRQLQGFLVLTRDTNGPIRARYAGRNGWVGRSFVAHDHLGYQKTIT